MMSCSGRSAVRALGRCSATHTAARASNEAAFTFTYCRYVARLRVLSAVPCRPSCDGARPVSFQGPLRHNYDLRRCVSERPTKVTSLRSFTSKRGTAFRARGHVRVCAMAQYSTETNGVVKRSLEDLQVRINAAKEVVDMPARNAQLADLENQAEASDLWDSPTKAQALMQAIASVRGELEAMEHLQSDLEDAQVALEFSLEDDDPQLLEEAASLSVRVEEGLATWETSRLLGGPHDSKRAVLTITAGAGGLDAMDWAGMLERMYLRWAEKEGRVVRCIERSEGDENLLKSCTLEVEGEFAYGNLRSERGTHRLVRLSPFNSKAIRQTSFAGVEVMPLLPEDSTEMEILEKDLEVTTMRSGGAGGQNVNKVETAVRITHLPTSIAVKCTEQRSQAMNKSRAMIILRGKLMVLLEEQRAADVSELRGDMVKAEWGQQIRNYVLHPYKMVKDVRTGEETSDVAAVMDGDINSFIFAFLRYRSRDSTETTNEP